MLILERNAGQGLFIGKDIYVEVLSVTGRHIQIGITAPREVQILREELVDENNPLAKQEQVTVKRASSQVI